MGSEAIYKAFGEKSMEEEARNVKLIYVCEGSNNIGFVHGQEEWFIIMQAIAIDKEGLC